MNENKLTQLLVSQQDDIAQEMKVFENIYYLQEDVGFVQALDDNTWYAILVYQPVINKRIVSNDWNIMDKRQKYDNHPMLVWWNLDKKKGESMPLEDVIDKKKLGEFGSEVVAVVPINHADSRDLILLCKTSKINHMLPNYFFVIIDKVIRKIKTKHVNYSWLGKWTGPVHSEFDYVDSFTTSTRELSSSKDEYLISLYAPKHAAKENHFVVTKDKEVIKLKPESSLSSRDTFIWRKDNLLVSLSLDTYRLMYLNIYRLSQYKLDRNGKHWFPEYENVLFTQFGRPNGSLNLSCEMYCDGSTKHDFINVKLINKKGTSHEDDEMLFDLNQLLVPKSK